MAGYFGRPFYGQAYYGAPYFGPGGVSAAAAALLPILRAAGAAIQRQEASAAASLGGLTMAGTALHPVLASGALGLRGLAVAAMASSVLRAAGGPITLAGLACQAMGGRRGILAAMHGAAHARSVRWRRP